MPRDLFNEDGLLRSFARNHPRRFALTLGTASTPEAAEILSGLSEPEIVPVLVQLPQYEVVHYLSYVDDAKLVNWLEEADIDDATRLAIRLPRERSRRLIPQVRNAKHLRALNELVNVRPNTAAALADKEYAWFSHKCSAAEALKTIRQYEDEDTTPVMILDDNDHVLGLADILSLVRLGDDEAASKSLQRVPVIPAGSPIYTVNNHPAWRFTSHLPVVDRAGRPIGLLSRQQLGDVTDLRGRQTTVKTSVLVEISTAMFEVLQDSVNELRDRRS